MSLLTPYITAVKLRQALSPATYMAIFDDDNTGNQDVVDASAQVALCMRRAHARIVSRLPDIYRTLPDGADAQIPSLLEDAELNYAIGIAWDRHPEYVRAFGENVRRKAAFDQAEAAMELIQVAILRIVDVPPEAQPRNVGGIVRDMGQRIFSDSLDGTRNSGDF